MIIWIKKKFSYDFCFTISLTNRHKVTIWMALLGSNAEPQMIRSWWQTLISTSPWKGKQTGSFQPREVPVEAVPGVGWPAGFPCRMDLPHSRLRSSSLATAVALTLLYIVRNENDQWRTGTICYYFNIFPFNLYFPWKWVSLSNVRHSQNKMGTMKSESRQFSASILETKLQINTDGTNYCMGCCHKKNILLCKFMNLTPVSATVTPLTICGLGC